MDNYRSLPIGTALPNVQQMLEVAPMLFGHVLRAAVGLALPVMVAMLAVNLAFGVLGRAAPALNPIQLGLPGPAAGPVPAGAAGGELGPPVQRVFDLSFDAARQLTADENLVTLWKRELSRRFRIQVRISHGACVTGSTKCMNLCRMS